MRRPLHLPAQGPPADDWRLHTYETAYLNGGERLAIATALAHLTASGVLEVDRKTGAIRTVRPLPGGDHALDRAVFRAAERGNGVGHAAVYHAAKPCLDEMEGSLRRQGFWVGGAGIALARIVPFGIASLPLVLGVAKTAVGIGRDRPVGFLIVGCLVGLTINLSLLTVPRRSRYGDRILDNGPYAYLVPRIMPAPSLSGSDLGGSSCGSSSDSPSSCGGGGCGGCGRGGD